MCLENYYLMDLPESIQGLKINGQQILLKYFINPAYSEALTFVVYLHELAHYLIKVIHESSYSEALTFVVYLHEFAHYLIRTDPNIVTFEDADSPISDRFQAKEAGFSLKLIIRRNIRPSN